MVGRSCSLKYLLSCLYFDTSSLRLFKTLSPKNKMWYFMVKQSMQFLEPGIYGLALSRILHSSDTSIFLLFWFHIKLDNSVAFCLFLYLKEFFLFIYYLIFYIVLYSLMYYILHSYIVLHIKYIALLLWDLSSLYVVVHLQSLLINTYPCCISKDIFVM